MEMSSMGTFASVSFRAIAFAVCFATVAGCDRTTVFTPDGTEVVIAPDAPKSVLFAVEEMTNLLSKAFGRDIPVVASPTPGKAGIYLGDNEWSRKAGIDVAPLKRDAFTIVSDGLNAYVAGRDDPNEDTHEAVYSPYTSVWNQLHEHATLFGVYEFLERYAGVRMYFPGELGTIIPKTTSLRVPATRFTVTPDFSVRNYSAFDDGMYFDGTNRSMKLLAERKLNYRRNRMQTLYVPCCHGSNGFRIQQRFAKEHPEYMALMERGGKMVRDTDPNVRAHRGQLCHSSAVYDEFFKDICSYAKGEPPEVRGMGYWRKGDKNQDWAIATFRKPWVDVMPQDSYAECHCEKCQAAYRKDGLNYATELIWGRTVELANRIKAAGLGIRITQMAYVPYRRIPDFDIPDNVDVMVAEGGPWSVSNPVKLQEEYGEIRRWSEKLKRPVWIWTYPNKYGGMNLPDIPNGTPRAWAKYFKDVSPWIFGTFAESENDRSFYNMLTYYVFGKVCWNTKVDVDALLDEYFRLMFGPAAKQMAALVDEIERKWVNEVAGNLVDTPLGPTRNPPSLYALFTKIYSPETIKRWEGWLDEAAALVPDGSLEFRRIALYRREILDPLAKSAKEYLDGISVEREVRRRAARKDMNILVNSDFTAPVDGRSNRHFGYYDSKTGAWKGGWICNKEDVPYVSFSDDVPPGVKGRSVRLTSVDKPRRIQIGNHFEPVSGNFKPGVRYRISYFVRLHNVVPGAADGGVGIRTLCDHNTWFPKNRITGTTDWIHQEFFFTAGKKSSERLSQFTLYLWHSTGAVEYAGLRIEPCEEGNAAERIER